MWKGSKSFAKYESGLNFAKKLENLTFLALIYDVGKCLSPHTSYSCLPSLYLQFGKWCEFVA